MTTLKTAARETNYFADKYGLQILVFATQSAEERDFLLVSFCLYQICFQRLMLGCYY